MRGRRSRQSQASSQSPIQDRVVRKGIGSMRRSEASLPSRASPILNRRHSQTSHIVVNETQFLDHSPPTQDQLTEGADNVRRMGQPHPSDRLLRRRRSLRPLTTRRPYTTDEDLPRVLDEQSDGGQIQDRRRCHRSHRIKSNGTPTVDHDVTPPFLGSIRRSEATFPSQASPMENRRRSQTSHLVETQSVDRSPPARDQRTEGTDNVRRMGQHHPSDQVLRRQKGLRPLTSGRPYNTEENSPIALDEESDGTGQLHRSDRFPQRPPIDSPISDEDSDGPDYVRGTGKLHLSDRFLQRRRTFPPINYGRPYTGSDEDSPEHADYVRRTGLHHPTDQLLKRQRTLRRANRGMPHNPYVETDNPSSFHSGESHPESSPAYSGKTPTESSSKALTVSQDGGGSQSSSQFMHPLNMPPAPIPPREYGREVPVSFGDGFYFVPSEDMLITEYLERKIADMELPFKDIIVVDRDREDDPGILFDTYATPEDRELGRMFFFKRLTNYRPRTGQFAQYRRRLDKDVTTGKTIKWKGYSKFSGVDITNKRGDVVGYKTTYIYRRPEKEDHMAWELTEYRVLDKNHWDRVLCKLTKITPRKTPRKRTNPQAGPENQVAEGVGGDVNVGNQQPADPGNHEDEGIGGNQGLDANGVHQHQAVNEGVEGTNENQVVDGSGVNQEQS